jgi:hypothetical protein
MKLRTITEVKGNRTLDEMTIPEEDVARMIQHCKDMDTASLIFVDDIVVYPGLYDSPSIQHWIKVVKDKLKS